VTSEDVITHYALGFAHCRKGGNQIQGEARGCYRSLMIYTAVCAHSASGSGMVIRP